jgi:hypothetical protein
MKKQLLFLGTLILAITLNAQVRTEKRNTDPFTEISLRIKADLFYVHGNEHSIEITGDDRTMDKVIAEVDGRKLIIHFSLEDRWLNSFTPEKLKIIVVSPEINGLSVLGSGNIIAEKPIETRNLELTIAGSGDIRLNQISCQYIETNISGSGNLMLSEPSTTKEIKINIAGSGDLFTPNLSSEAAYILIAGSGDCELAVSSYLDAKIFGSGNINYIGEPTLKTTVAGSGKIRKNN